MKNILFFALAIFLSNAVHANPYPAPSDVVRDYFKSVDAGDFAAVDKILAANFQASAPFSPQPFDKSSWLGVGKGFKTAFPDMHHELLSVVETGFTVAVKGVFNGKNDGPNMGAPATGNLVTIPFVAFFELDQSWKIKNFSIVFDQKSFEAQLTAGLPNQVAVAEMNVRALLAAVDDGDVNLYFNYCTPDAKAYFSGLEVTSDQLKSRITGLKTAFPDIKRNIDEIAVSGSTVAVRGYITGTNSGSFMGRPATGKTVKTSYLAFYKLNDAGKVTTSWVESDIAGLQQQLYSRNQESGK